MVAQVVNVHEAKTQLSRLLERVEQGEEIVIGRAGKPVAKLVPYHPVRRPRKPGGWEGKVWMADDFDELPPDLLKAFSGEDD
jgi:prevent-host-death family protein